MRTTATSCLGVFAAIILCLAGIGAGPVLAQDGTTPRPMDTLDTVLARGAAQGFLTVLTRADLAGSVTFYLADGAGSESILAGLEGVTGYEVNEAGWESDITYRLRATLQPGDRQVSVYTGKHDGRWLVEKLALTDTETAETTGGSPAKSGDLGTTDSAAAARGAPAGESLSVSDLKPVTTAQVISERLNMRQGPGPDYSIQSTLSHGDEVSVLARNGRMDWILVSTTADQAGWVYAECLAVDGSLADVPLVTSAQPGENLPTDQVAALVRTTGQSPSAGGMPQADTQPAGSPPPTNASSGGRVVFQTHSGGDIYVINTDGTGLRRLTTGIDPQLSPDGNQVAFTRWDPHYELCTVNTDGSGEQCRGGSWRQMKSPSWSADSSKLIFSWQNGGRLEEIRESVSLADAANQEEPIQIPRNATRMEVADGVLKYVVPADAHWSLTAFDLGTGETTDLRSELHSYGPSGHPTDPTLVIYRGDRGLALHNLSTDQDQDITSDAGDHTPVISPDGTRIAVSFWQNDHWEVHTMNLDGSNRQRLTSTPLSVMAEKRALKAEYVDGKERYVANENPSWNNAAPTWSPDGSQIAFVTDRTDRWEIWVMNADGSNQRPMFSNGALDGLTLEYAGMDERMLSWR